MAELTELEQALRDILSDAYYEGVADFHSPTGLFDDIKMIEDIKRLFAKEQEAQNE